MDRQIEIKRSSPDESRNHVRTNPPSGIGFRRDRNRVPTASGPVDPDLERDPDTTRDPTGLAGRNRDGPAIPVRLKGSLHHGHAFKLPGFTPTGGAGDLIQFRAERLDAHGPRQGADTASQQAIDQLIEPGLIDLFGPTFDRGQAGARLFRRQGKQPAIRPGRITRDQKLHLGKHSGTGIEPGGKAILKTVIATEVPERERRSHQLFRRSRQHGRDRISQQGFSPLEGDAELQAFELRMFGKITLPIERLSDGLLRIRGESGFNRRQIEREIGKTGISPRTPHHSEHHPSERHEPLHLETPRGT